jgi:hypothetical protein
MSDFTEADVDRGVAALWAKRYPYSADYVACVLAAVAPAMRDRWRKEWEAELRDELTAVATKAALGLRSGGDQ